MIHLELLATLALVGSRGLVLALELLHARLRHEVGDVLLQVIDAAAHVIDSSNYLVRHGLKFVLHLLEQCLHHGRQVLDALRVGLGDRKSVV